MKKAVILLHGWNVTDWMKTVGLLKPYFEALGYRVEVLDYGYWPSTRQATKGNPEVARRLEALVCDLTGQGYVVDVVGHSNGCTITHIASREYQIPVNTFVAINPALDKDVHPCPTAKLVQVWHNSGDRAVVLGKWLRWFSPWAKKARPWGEMGKKGYRGDSQHPSVISFDAGEDFKVIADGHSDMFKKDKREFFLARSAEYCDEMLTAIMSRDAGV